MRLLACLLLAASLQAQTPSPQPAQDNAGRQALTAQLDAIAARETAARRDTIARIHTRAQALARQREVRARLIALLGGPWPAHAPLHPRITGASVHEGIRIERILFDSQPNFPVTALLYLPHMQAPPQPSPRHLTPNLSSQPERLTPNLSSRPERSAVERPAFASAQKLPAILMAPHPTPKLSSQPEHPTPNLSSRPERSAVERPAFASAQKFPAILMAPGHSPLGKAGDAATALLFAHAGFAVLSYDPIGQGERLQYPDPANPGHTLLKGPTGEHGEAGLQPTLIGDALARYFLIDAVRAVDYLLTRSEIDSHRIGAFGCSGGGLMTALTAALDPRIAAAGVACFTTSFDTLLPTLGPQDSEQSTPNFIASGLVFPDWSELFAPKPYAIIATTEDMFPFAGAQSTEREARTFYTLFHAGDNLAFITGPGHHGHLQPIMPRILNFFVTHLHPTPDATAKAVLALAAGPVVDDPNAPRPSLLPVADTQVTPTGQVSSSFPNVETVFSLNLKRAAEKIPPHTASSMRRAAENSPSLARLQHAIREVTRMPPDTGIQKLAAFHFGPHIANVYFPQTPSSPELDLGTLSIPSSPGRHPAVLWLTGARYTNQDHTEQAANTGDSAEDVLVTLHGDRKQTQRLTEAGNTVLAFEPRPSPPGTEETKSPVLGVFYLTELRAELTGNTLMGLRIDDVLHAVDFLCSRPDVDPDNITAEASGHLALVLLHAAVIDPRIRHITLHDLPPTYTEYLHQPIPRDAPQDILPGVLLHYDTPDLIHALGPRVTMTAP